MTTAGFHEAVAAMAAPTNAPSDLRAPARVTILGSGVEGRVLAAVFLAEGATEVNLFSVYADELAALESGSITLRGAGPVGTFRVGGDSPSIVVTSVLDRSVAEADLIVVTGPVLKQRTYGLVLAPHLRDGQTILVMPGRTLAVLELHQAIRAGGSAADVRLIEAVDMPFDIVEETGQLHLTRGRATRAGVYPSGATSALDSLRTYLPDLDGVGSILDSSLSDGSGAVEVPTLIIQGSAAAGDGAGSPPGTTLVSPDSFRDLLGPTQERLLAGLWEERVNVAAGVGIRNLPELDQVIDEVAGSTENDQIRLVPGPEEARRVLRDAVLGSLAPLTSIAKMCGVAVPLTDALIDVSESVLGRGLRSSGRTIGATALAGLDPSRIRNRVSEGL